MLPHTLDELVALPGIGRKTANVILGNAFDVPGITVDTHFGRLVRRWGWTAEDDPVKVEHAVGALVPKRDWTIVSHRVIFHGRRVCHARKPACGACTLAADCPVLRHRPHRPGAGRGAGQGPVPGTPARLVGIADDEAPAPAGGEGRTRRDPTRPTHPGARRHRPSPPGRGRRAHPVSPSVISRVAPQRLDGDVVCRSTRSTTAR